MEIYWIYNNDFVRHTEIKDKAISNFNNGGDTYALVAYFLNGRVMYAEIPLPTFYCFITRASLVNRTKRTYDIVPFTVIKTRRNFNLVTLEE